MPADGPGTLLFAVQAAIVARLEERLVDARVRYEPPRVDRDVATEVGVMDAIWFDPETTELTYEIPVFHGPYSATNPLWLDETAIFDVVVQAIRPQGSQASADERAAELLRDVLAVLTTQPSVPASDTAELLSLWLVPQTTTVQRGALPSSTTGHGCQFRLRCEARSRLKLT